MSPEGRHLVIGGGGFAGLWAAIGAAAALQRHAGTDKVTMLTQDPCLTIRPRLYERVPEGIRVPLEPVLEQIGAELEIARIAAVEPASRLLLLEDDRGAGRELRYDALVLATGSRFAAPPFEGGDRVLSPGTPAEAALLWDRLDSIAAERRASVVVVGAGLTGIELATEIATEHREARVVLLDAAAELAASYEPKARRAIVDGLTELGIEVRRGARVSSIEEDAVAVDGGERIEADLVAWCGGMEAVVPPIAGEPRRDPLGRLHVGPDLSISDLDGVFAAGDAAAVGVAEDRLAPMSCQMAIPIGKAAGRNAAARLLGLPAEPFSHEGYVTCLDLGGAGALFTLGWERRFELSGAEGKDRKRLINRTLIYPPSGRERLLAAGSADAGAAARIASAAG
jgi:NADH dehydrogenase